MIEALTLKDFIAAHQVLRSSIPEFPEGELTFVLMADFYDGPIKGVVEYKGQQFWYEIVSDYVEQRKQYFALVELSCDEFQNEQFWHNKFEEYVSLGFTEEVVKEWENTYGVYQKQREHTYAKKKVVGWFQMY